MVKKEVSTVIITVIITYYYYCYRNKAARTADWIIARQTAGDQSSVHSQLPPQDNDFSSNGQSTRRSGRTDKTIDRVSCGPTNRLRTPSIRETSNCGSTRSKSCSDICTAQSYNDIESDKTSSTAAKGTSAENQAGIHNRNKNTKRMIKDLVEMKIIEDSASPAQGFNAYSSDNAATDQERPGGTEDDSHSARQSSASGHYSEIRQPSMGTGPSGQAPPLPRRSSARPVPKDDKLRSSQEPVSYVEPDRCQQPDQCQEPDTSQEPVSCAEPDRCQQPDQCQEPDTSREPQTDLRLLEVANTKASCPEDESACVHRNGNRKKREKGIRTRRARNGKNKKNCTIL